MFIEAYTTSDGSLGRLMRNILNIDMAKLRARGMLWQFGSLAPHKSISKDVSLLCNNACRAFGLSMNYKVLDLENDGAIKSFQI